MLRGLFGRISRAIGKALGRKPRAKKEPPGGPIIEPPLTRRAETKTGLVVGPEAYENVEGAVRIVKPGILWLDKQGSMRPRIEYRGQIFGKKAKQEAIFHINDIARARHVLVIEEIDEQHYDIYLDYVEDMRGEETGVTPPAAPPEKKSGKKWIRVRTGVYRLVSDE